MADTMRYRRGDTKPVFVAPASATEIEVGDLLYLDPTTSQPKTASQMTDQGTESLNQDAFQQYFLGVAEQGSDSGDTDPIRIATEGEFEFACDSATFTVGDLVGADENSDGDGLLDQAVKAAASASLAIGRVPKTYATATTSVLVRIKSTIMEGGIQSQVAGSSSGVI